MTVDPVALTPLSFLDRAAAVYGDRVAWVEGQTTYTYRQLHQRCRRLAGALLSIGIHRGDRVSLLAPNVLVALEAHFGVPYAGAVLNALNTRLSIDELSSIVEHAEARILLADHEWGDRAHAVARNLPGLRVVVAGGLDDEYEQLVGDAEPASIPVADEHSLLSLNYTSGTTGRPKGVMYSHRGAYLQALAMVSGLGLSTESVFLWTLPMFHCNGWCFPWAVTAGGGTHVGLRQVEERAVWSAVRERGVTHFNAAPTVLLDLAFSPGAAAGPAPQMVRVATGGAPPTPELLAELERLNFDVTHLYGLTETYGPAVICEWRTEWDREGPLRRARLRARQGIANLVTRPVRVIDDHGFDVPADGTTPGEVLLSGSTIMLGYYRDAAATELATLDGWLRTGDLGVLHPDGHLELKDRLKDVIISGGENIASIEVEQALSSHPAVLECAVVAEPHSRWGEVPVAFVVLRAGATTSEHDLIEHVRGRIARFKAPKRIVFGELPKTATGKVRKHELRDQVSDLAIDNQKIKDFL